MNSTKKIEDDSQFKQSNCSSKVAIDFFDYEKLTRFSQGPLVQLVQLEAGSFEGYLFHNKLEHFNVSLFQVNRCIKYFGTSPQTRWAFVFFARSPTQQSLWNYKGLTEDHIVVMPPGTEIDCATQSAVEMGTIHISEELLYRVCQILELPEPRQLFGNHKKVLAYSSGQRKRVCAMVNCLNQSLTHNAEHLIESMHFLRSLEWEILVCLVRTVSELLDISKKPLPPKRFIALKTAEMYITEHLSDPISLGDICQAAHISQRTLIYLFQDYYGVTPKAYLKRLRLSAVHKQLKQAKSAGQEISAIAQRFGFTHMGQFAQDYQKHFGKLPSQVLRETT
ncbi:MAG: helix-turn-helix domain-containing protein [Nodosilinea sp.]